MEQLSPISRKLIALALLFLTLVSLLNLGVLPALSGTDDLLERLRDARFRLARLESVEARPLPPPGDPIPSDAWIRSSDRQSAEAAFVAVINASAGRTQVALDRAVPVSAANSKEPRLTLDIVATGPEPALATFIGDVEQGSPLIRFQHWKLSAPETAGGPARFEAQAITVWNTPR
jgi:hypothetical protein